MNTLAGIAGFLAVAALTPGPNNLIVMRKAAGSGLAGTLPAMAGVVCGGIALLVLVTAGAGALFAAEPRLRLAITLGGCLYLAWLAVGMMLPRRAQAESGASTIRRMPDTGFVGMFALQFLNPKGWLMLLTAVSAIATTSMYKSLAVVTALFIPLSLAGLFAWAFFGTSIAAWRMQGTTHAWLDRIMGGLLLCMAVLLLFTV